MYMYMYMYHSNLEAGSRLMLVSFCGGCIRLASAGMHRTGRWTKRKVYVFVYLSIDKYIGGHVFHDAFDYFSLCFLDRRMLGDRWTPDVGSARADTGGHSIALRGSRRWLLFVFFWQVHVGRQLSAQVLRISQAQHRIHTEPKNNERISKSIGRA